MQSENEATVSSRIGNLCTQVEDSRIKCSQLWVSNQSISDDHGIHLSSLKWSSMMDDLFLGDDGLQCPNAIGAAKLNQLK